MRNWRELHPKKLGYDSRGVTFWAWPDTAGPFDLRREEQKQTSEWIEFRDRFPKAYAEWIDPGSARRANEALRRVDAIWDDLYAFD